MSTNSIPNTQPTYKPVTPEQQKQEQQKQQAQTTEQQVQQTQVRAKSEGDANAVGASVAGVEPSAAVKAKAARHAELAIKKYGGADGAVDAKELDQWVKDLGGNAQASATFTNTDKDGVLTKAEIQNAYERQYAGEEANAAAAQAETQAKQADAERQTRADKAADKAIASQDKDGDGQLNAAEVKDWSKDGKDFDPAAQGKAWNKDGDLQISKPELSQAYKGQYDREAGVQPQAATPKTEPASQPQATTPKTEPATQPQATTPKTEPATQPSGGSGGGTPETPAQQTPSEWAELEPTAQQIADNTTHAVISKGDKDGDAALDQDEMLTVANGNEADRDADFKKYNANGDLRVTAQELNDGIMNDIKTAVEKQPEQPKQPPVDPKAQAEAEAQAKAAQEAEAAAKAQAEAEAAKEAAAEQARQEAEAAKAEAIKQAREEDALLKNCLDEIGNSGGLDNARANAAAIIAAKRPGILSPEVVAQMPESVMRSFMNKITPEQLHAMPAASRDAMRDELDDVLWTSAQNQPYVDRLATSLQLHP